MRKATEEEKKEFGFETEAWVIELTKGWSGGYESDTKQDIPDDVSCGIPGWNSFGRLLQFCSCC